MLVLKTFLRLSLDNGKFKVFTDTYDSTLRIFNYVWTSVGGLWTLWNCTLDFVWMCGCLLESFMAFIRFWKGYVSQNKKVKP